MHAFQLCRNLSGPTKSLLPCKLPPDEFVIWREVRAGKRFPPKSARHGQVNNLELNARAHIPQMLARANAPQIFNLEIAISTFRRSIQIRPPLPRRLNDFYPNFDLSFAQSLTPPPLNRPFRSFCPNCSSCGELNQIATEHGLTVSHESTEPRQMRNSRTVSLINARVAEQDTRFHLFTGKMVICI